MTDLDHNTDDDAPASPQFASWEWVCVHCHRNWSHDPELGDVHDRLYCPECGEPVTMGEKC